MLSNGCQRVVLMEHILARALPHKYPALAWIKWAGSIRPLACFSNDRR